MAFRFAAILIIIVFLALSFGAVKTARPYRDEAFVSNPAYNLAVHGYMGTTVCETMVSPEKAAEIDAGTQLLPGLVGRPNSTAAMIGGKKPDYIVAMDNYEDIIRGLVKDEPVVNTFILTG